MPPARSARCVVFIDGDEGARRDLIDLGYEVRDAPRDLAAFPTLAAGIVHDLTNPLAVIVTNASVISEDLETLRGRVAPDSPLRRELEQLAAAHADVTAAALRILAIVADLRARA